MSEWNYSKWAYETGLKNLGEHREAGDFLLAQANALLTIVLAGMGGGIALGAKIFEAGGPIAWGAAVSAAWLAVVGVVLAHRCIVTRETQLQHNEPKNIYKPDTGLTETQVYRYEAENVQERIERTKRRNASVARWLDRCRYAVIVTPLVFSAAASLGGR